MSHRPSHTNPPGATIHPTGLRGARLMTDEILETADDAAPVASGPHIPGARRRRLLIVDDRELTCKQLQKLLQTDALTVEYRTEGSEALKALKEADYSILLTDLQMP